MTLMVMVMMVVVQSHIKMKIIGDLPDGFQTFPAASISVQDFNSLVRTAAAPMEQRSIICHPLP